jgi:hypothetical protein
MNKKKILGAISVAALILGLVSTAGAHAAIGGSIRWNQASSAGFGWAVENKAAEADYNNFTKYYTANVKLWDVIAPVGGKVDLEYIVKDSSGNPLANTAVTIIYNPAYSIGTAKATSGDDTPIGLPKGGPNDGLLVSATTDANGKVAFSVINTDTTGDPAIANDGVTTPVYQRDNLYTQIQIYSGGFDPANRGKFQTSQDLDIVEIHFMNGVTAKTPAAPKATATPTPTATATPTPTPTATQPPVVVTPNPSIRLISPVYTSANSVDSTSDIAQYYSPATKAFYTYLAAGSTVSLTYHVTLDGTAPGVNKTVELYVNSAYSGSKANWTSGSTKIAPPAAVDATFGAKLVGVTDAKGNVTFKLTNTDTKALEVAPATANQDRGAIKPARLFGTIKPVLAGITDDKAEDTDLVTFDIYAGPKAATASKTITCVKGKASKKVTGAKPVCPKGYALKK